MLKQALKVYGFLRIVIWKLRWFIIPAIIVGANLSEAFYMLNALGSIIANILSNICVNQFYTYYISYGLNLVVLENWYFTLIKYHLLNVDWNGFGNITLNFFFEIPIVLIFYFYQPIFYLIIFSFVFPFYLIIKLVGLFIVSLQILPVLFSSYFYVDFTVYGFWLFLKFLYFKTLLIYDWTIIYLTLMWRALNYYFLDYLFASLGVHILKVSFLFIYSVLKTIFVSIILNFFHFLVCYINYNTSQFFAIANFVKFCIIIHDWNFPTISFNFRIGYYLYSVIHFIIPFWLEKFFVVFIYDPILSFYYYYYLYYKIKFYPYFELAVHSIFWDPLYYFNVLGHIITREAAFDPITNAAERSFSKRYATGTLFMPARFAESGVWLGYIFTFIYVFVNSVMEFIYVYVVKFGENLVFFYETKYILRVSLFFKLIFDYFIIPIATIIVSLCDVFFRLPFTILDYFVWRPTGVHWFFNWELFDQSQHWRWHYIITFPKQTLILLIVILSTNLFNIVPISIEFYVYDFYYREFIIFFNYILASLELIIFLIIKGIIYSSFIGITTLFFSLNFLLNAFLLNLICFPIAVSLLITNFAKFVFEFSFWPLASLFYFNVQLFVHEVFDLFLNLSYSFIFLDSSLLIEVFSQENIATALVFLFIGVLKILFNTFVVKTVFAFYMLFHKTAFGFLAIAVEQFQISISVSSATIPYIISQHISDSPTYFQFLALGQIPLVYVILYYCWLCFVLLYFYVFMSFVAYNTFKYFRLAAILLEIERLIDIRDKTTQDLHFALNYKQMNLGKVTTTLSTDRQPDPVFYAFYRYWFGAGHNHFIDYRWRSFSSRTRSWTRVKIYYLSKPAFYKFFDNANFFYNGMDYVKHIRHTFFRLMYSANRLHHLYWQQHFFQYNCFSSAFGSMYNKSLNLKFFTNVSNVKVIPKYGFPFFKTIQTILFKNSVGLGKFTIEESSTKKRNFFAMFLPSYLTVSNLIWYVYFVSVFSFTLLTMLLKFIFFWLLAYIIKLIKKYY